MDALLDRRTNTLGTIPDEKGPPPELPEEQKELLRSLGYLTGDAPAGEAAEGESDRKPTAGGEESAGANRNGGGDQ